MHITQAAIKALAPGGRLEGPTVGTVRVAVERSADGEEVRWLRETLDAAGGVASRRVVRVKRPGERWAAVGGAEGRPRSVPSRGKGRDSAFGRRLAALREAAGLSPAELSRRSGVFHGTISHFEAGLRSPSWVAVQALADALGVATDDFRELKRGAKPKRAAKGKK